MDISELVKNPFVIGGIIIVVFILLFGRYFFSLSKQKNNYDNWNLENETDYNLNYIKQLQNKTFYECMKECDDNSECKAVVFDRDGLTDVPIDLETMKTHTFKNCWIKNATENKYHPHNRISLLKPL